MALRWTEKTKAMNLDDLKELQRLLNHAIESMDAGTMFDMSEAEKVNHLNAYGDNAAVIGDFVIRKRVPMPWDDLTRKIPQPPPVVDSQAGDRNRCAYCNTKLGYRSYQAETGNWVATGKFPTHDFCSPECGKRWLAALNLPLPSDCLKIPLDR